jgi:hypothetical protein
MFVAMFDPFCFRTNYFFFLYYFLFILGNILVMLGIGNISISGQLVSYGIVSRELMCSSPTELSSLEKNWSLLI